MLMMLICFAVNAEKTLFFQDYQIFQDIKDRQINILCAFFQI